MQLSAAQLQPNSASFKATGSKIRLMLSSCESLVLSVQLSLAGWSHFHPGIQAEWAQHPKKKPQTPKRCRSLSDAYRIFPDNSLHGIYLPTLFANVLC